jgi:hypothetical protein
MGPAVVLGPVDIQARSGVLKSAEICFKVTRRR